MATHPSRPKLTTTVEREEKWRVQHQPNEVESGQGEYHPQRPLTNHLPGTQSARPDEIPMLSHDETS
jgi:hypothetical protein